jgi:hypothetical protein
MSHGGQGSATPISGGVSPASTVSEVNPPLQSCAGAPALIRPWQPHPLCRDCLRYTRIGTSVIPAAVKRVKGGFDCVNRVVA